MQSWWVNFERGAGCVQAINPDQARSIAAHNAPEFGDVREVRTLPHPAQPRLNEYRHPQYGVSPSFCFQPRACAGRTACPCPYACSE